MHGRLDGHGFGLLLLLFLEGGTLVVVGVRVLPALYLFFTLSGLAVHLVDENEAGNDDCYDCETADDEPQG